MFDPNPMEVIDEGGRITIILEECDIRRTIHLGKDAGPGQERSPLGFPVGRREDGTTAWGVCARAVAQV